MELSYLTPDALFSLSIQLELPELLKFCATSKKINNMICKKDNIWLYKLNTEFPNWKELKEDKDLKNPITLVPIINANSFKNIYITLYYWNILNIFKEKLKISDNIYTIYRARELFLANKKIKEIPNLKK